MKKLLLLSAAAMLACSASAQTLTKAWEYITDLPAYGDARYGTAGNGAIYAADKTNNKLVIWNETGKTEFANENVTNTAITMDDAGNIIGTKGWAGGNNSLNFYIVAAGTNAITSFDVTLPEGVEKGILFSMGRAVGNVLSAEGGYIYYAPNGQTKVVCVKIVNGQQATAYASTDTGITFNSTLVQPAASFEDLASEENPANCCYVRTRSTQVIYYYSEEWKSYAQPSNGRTCDGFDVFELQGVKFGIFPTAVSGHNTSFAIVNLETGNTIVEFEETGTNPSTSNYYQTLVAEKENETTVNIYQYFAGIAVRKLVLTVPADYTTAIESVVADNAAVEYFNLQGVKVANPQNGLFIKKQGNKAVKVVL